MPAPPMLLMGSVAVICSPGSGELFGVPQLSELRVGVVALSTATPWRQMLTVAVPPLVTVVFCESPTYPSDLLAEIE